MRGRAMEAVVSPFSFREMLRHAGREPAKPVDRLTKVERSQLGKDLQDYLAQGGFPEAQWLDSRNPGCQGLFRHKHYWKRAGHLYGLPSGWIQPRRKAELFKDQMSKLPLAINLLMMS